MIIIIIGTSMARYSSTPDDVAVQPDKAARMTAKYNPTFF